MANIQTAGIATLSIDGQFYDVASALSYSVNTLKQEGLVGQSGFQGFKASWVYGTISVQLRDTGTVSTGYFNALQNVTVVAQLANGKVITGTGMFTDDVQTVNTEDGTFELKLSGSVVDSTGAI